MNLRRFRKRSPRVDVIPLIDVLMVLILFFLTSMQFQDLRALNVKLPKIDSAGSNKISNQLVVSISKGATTALASPSGTRGIIPGGIIPGGIIPTTRLPLGTFLLPMPRLATKVTVALLLAASSS